MKKMLAIIALTAILALPAASFADAAKLIPPYHWTYHALAELVPNKLIDEKVEPGKTAFTPEQVVSLVLFALNRIQQNPQRMDENELRSMRQLINGYKTEIENSGRDPVRLRSDLESYAAAAGFTALEPDLDAQTGRKLSAAAAEAVNSFAFDIYKHAAEKNGSLLLSPYSISAALSMVYAGARGQTAAEMEKVLRVTPDIHRHMAALISEIDSVSADTASVSTANAVWPAQRGKLLPDFTQTVRESYAAGITPLDYRKNPAKAAEVINNWVEKHTAGKIKNIIGAGMLSTDTPLVLTNAVYFKTAWADEFDAADTRAEPFWLSPSKSVRLPMMHQTFRSLLYAKINGAALAELPYKNGRFSMLVLLPDKNSDIANIESELSEMNLHKWRSELKQAHVQLTLPKFRTETSCELSSMLAAMGMPAAFSSAADFSAIEGNTDIYLGRVLHKTFIDVAEKGTEAAAATAVIMMTSAAPSPEKPIAFRADRPFVYLIRDNEAGAILFIGRYTGK